VSRRELLEVAATGALGVALASRASSLKAAPEEPLAPAALEQWKRELRRALPRKVYTSSESPQAAMPLGGIGCGNVYLGVGGHLKDWLIFNNVTPIQVPDTFFFVRMKAEGKASVARVLQTALQGYSNVGQYGGTYKASSRVSDAEGRHVKRTSLVGEYPCAELTYEDDALPGKVTLEALTPLVPLEQHQSVYPGAAFLFRVENPTASPLEVSLAFSVRNAAGGGRGGGNQNRLLRAGKVTGVGCGLMPGQKATLGGPVRVATNQRDFNPEGIERPEGLELTHLEGGGLRGVGASGATPSVVWLEDPESLTQAEADALTAAVRGGAALLLSGRAPRLLQDWANTRALRGSQAKQDIPFEDFESGTYANWQVEGTAFGRGPAKGTLEGQQVVSGFTGAGLVNSFLGGDEPTGRMLSKPFTIERKFVKFLIGGGNSPGKECVNLLVDGKVVRTGTGRNEERLLPAAWNVADLQGKEARIEVIDAETGGWGHVNVDEIVFSDMPGRVLPEGVVAALDGLMPVEFRAWEWPQNPTPVQARGGGKKSIQLNLAGKAKLVGAKLAPGSRGSADVCFTREVGRGSVLVAASRLVGAEGSDGTASQRQALALLASLAGVSHKSARGADPEALDFGEMAFGTTGPDATVLTAWSDPQSLWTQFAKSGRFSAPSEAKRSKTTELGEAVNGAVASTVVVPPKGQVTVPFNLTWRFPNYRFDNRRIGNQYCKLWPSAQASLEDLARATEASPAASAASATPSLRHATDRFRRALYDSTLPSYVLDCIGSQISTLRSEVCVWSEDGTFAGYEGSDGCCPMNCSHVWGYEQTISRLFPALERNMRDADLLHQQRQDGGMNNRISLPLQPRPTGERPFADGHASGILKTYRETLNSAAGDTWLKERWPHVQRAVDYMVTELDADGDGIIEAEQWNTYDCAVYGPNSFIGTYYLAALRAGEEMAKRMGQPEPAAKWRGIFEKGQKRLVDLCWNGEYFVQVLPDYQQRSTQYGPGCLADQLIGQWWAHQLDLGYVLPQELVKKALQSVFRYNWMPDLINFKHNQRVFADGHDKGLLCCTWPTGGRPDRPILYCDEVWSGVEYQVAGHMVYEGLLDEALSIVRGARERYDGRKRNPWNELECGGHYARAMASWSLLLGATGFLWDGPRGEMTFAPVVSPDKHRSLYTTGESWGTLAQTREGRQTTVTLEVIHGALPLRQIRLGESRGGLSPKVEVGGKPIAATARAEAGRTVVVLAAGPEDRLRLKAGDTLKVTV
jgi:uncharacterized protein (DUF608 family)